MKKGNCIKPMVFLIAILFSFSVNAYNSLYSNAFTSTKKERVNAPLNNSAVSVSIIFEELETENDNDNFPAEAFLILPFSCFSFKTFENEKPDSSGIISSKAVKPIFLSSRALRI